MLDDPSFWMVLASAVAALYVHAANRVEPGNWKLARTMGVWLFTTAVLGAVYILAMRRFHEGWFTEDQSIAITQRTEFVLQILYIAVAALVFARALSCLSAVIAQARARSEGAKRAAECLASAGVGPFTTAAFAFGVWKLIEAATLRRPDWLSPFVPLRALAVLAFALPFFILFGLTLLRLRRVLAFRFKKLEWPPPPFDTVLSALGADTFPLRGYYQAR